MRHLKSGRKLGRTRSHRRATLSALSVSLIRHKKIRTTTAKAKEARMVVEKLITRAKRAIQKEGDGKVKDVHARRQVFAFLRDRSAVSMLFNDIAAKVVNRPGGYTRIVKLGRRHGDGAELAVLELVDYNLGQEKAAPKTKASARRKTTKKGKPGAAVPAKSESGVNQIQAAEPDASASEPSKTESKQG